MFTNTIGKVCLLLCNFYIVFGLILPAIDLLNESHDALVPYLTMQSHNHFYAYPFALLHWCWKITWSPRCQCCQFLRIWANTSRECTIMDNTSKIKKIRHNNVHINEIHNRITQIRKWQFYWRKPFFTFVAPLAFRTHCCVGSRLPPLPQASRLAMR